MSWPLQIKKQEEEQGYIEELGEIFEGPDLRSQNKRLITLGDYDPTRPHMTVAPGLNFEAICSNNQCQLEGNIVWVQKGFGTFYIGYTVDHLDCPVCKKRIKFGSFKSLGYVKAKIKFVGRKVGEQQQFVLEDEQLVGKFVKYEGYKDGQTCKWHYLMAEVSKLS